MKLLLLNLILFMAALVGCGREGNHAKVVDYGALRQLVIKHVKEGSISPDTAGKAILRDDEKAACAGGCIYISNDPNLGLLIIFVESYEPDGVVPASGLLFCDNGIKNLWDARRVRIAGMDWRLVRPEDNQFCSVARM
jgi:hypothetical protein